MSLNKVYWETLCKRSAPKQNISDIKTEIAIVGGGMAGLMCAEKLAGKGRSVTVIEKNYCGAGASGKSSGFITPDSEIELSSLIDNYGPEQAKDIWEFVLSGVEAIRETIKKLKIECDYQIQDSLFIATSRRGIKHVEAEHHARGSLGYKSIFYNQADLPLIVGSNRYYSAVRYPDTFGINSYLYCQALKGHLIRKGVQIYEASPVNKIVPNGLEVNGYKITADKVIVSADRFIPDFGKLKQEIYHIQTFLAITAPLSQDVLGLFFKEKPLMVWDTQLVYNYFRLTGENRLLLGGGDVLYTYAKNEAKNTDRFAGRLKRYFNQYFPEVGIKIEYIWPGMLGVSKDLMPIVGSDMVAPNVYYIGAATGLPWAAALGRYVADKITDGRDDHDLQFSPQRKFIIGPRIQKLIGTPPTFAISHGITKYF